jgi:hypothetical protein
MQEVSGCSETKAVKAWTLSRGVIKASRCGSTPRDKPTETGLSFPGLGQEGSTDVAIALFTFPDDATYLQYREQVAKDPDGVAANARFRENPPCQLGGPHIGPV